MNPSRPRAREGVAATKHAAEKSFPRLMVELDYPMVVVTAHGEEGPAGCLVGFGTQCSIDPPRYLVCLSDKNRTERVARHGEVLAVHFLTADDVDLARAFGEQTTDDTDTFSRCAWHPGPGGAPILDACGRWFVGAILERRPLGEHVAYFLQPVAVSDGGVTVNGGGVTRGAWGPGLMFQDVRDLDPGHPP
jgi:flavin reductase (DIM6/NTAB) family NADH-FMN oxidoreductase RutF